MSTQLIKLISQVHNAKVRLLLGIDNSIDKTVLLSLIDEIEDFNKDIDIRYLGLVQMFFYIIDKSLVLIKIIDPVTGSFDFSSIAIKENSLAKTFEIKFNTLRDKSKKLLM